MSIRRLRQVLTYLTIILASIAVTLLFYRYQEQKGLRTVASEITRICELPEVPEELTIRRAFIDASDNPEFVDVFLALSGPKDTLHDWLEEVDKWEKRRPGAIQNHRTREAEMTYRVDFTAEVSLR